VGQKTNPIGLRVGVNKDWRSKWYSPKKEFGTLLAEDRKIREILKKKLETASVPKILIERAASRCRITILTARPGVVIGRKGSEIDKLKEDLSKMTGKEIYVDIMEIKSPEIDAQLWRRMSRSIGRRVSFRRHEESVADRQGFRCGRHQDSLRRRLGGAELARVEKYHWGHAVAHVAGEY
jgi:small subunit ribosomal protein S3